MGKYLSPEDFVVAYVTASTLEEVVKTTGMRKDAIKARAGAYRKLGVKLPKLDVPKGLDSLRIAQLNSLVNKYDIRKKRG